MNQNLQPKIKLNNGHLIPQLGLGVCKASLMVTKLLLVKEFKMVSRLLAVNVIASFLPLKFSMVIKEIMISFGKQ